MTFRASGESRTADVKTAATCQWTVESLPPWLTLDGSASRTGNGVVTLRAGANPDTVSRQATIRVAGQEIAVTQQGVAPPCEYDVTPPTASFTAAGGDGTVTVTTTASCAWTATADVPWITVAPGSHTGTGSLSYQVAASTTASARTGHITVQGKTVTVSQEGAATTLTFDSVTLSAGTCADATTYLASFGIKFVQISGGASPIICNSTGTAVTPTSSPNVFFGSPVETNTDESFDLVFSTPVDHLSFSRATAASNTTVPQWGATAFDASNNELSRVGEDRIFAQPERTFTLAGPGIVRLRFEAFNSGRATFNFPPIDDLTLITTASETVKLR